MKFKCYLRKCSDSILEDLKALDVRIVNEQNPNCLLYDANTMTATTLNSMPELNGNIDCAQNDTFF